VCCEQWVTVAVGVDWLEDGCAGLGGCLYVEQRQSEWGVGSALTRRLVDDAATWRAAAHRVTAQPSQRCPARGTPPRPALVVR